MFTAASEAPHNRVPACPLSLAHHAPATLALLLLKLSRHSEPSSDVTSSEKPSLTTTSSKQPHTFPVCPTALPQTSTRDGELLRAAMWGSFRSLAHSHCSSCAANTCPFSLFIAAAAKPCSL